MGRFTHKITFEFFPIFCVIATLTGCGKSNEKSFQPIVVKEGSLVRAISSEEAKVLCADHYCEENQVYTSYFGRRKSDPPSAPAPAPAPESPSQPGPTSPPTSYPSQPRQQSDYSRSLLGVSSAWKYTQGRPETIVAVIDSGVDYFHPDLKENILVGASSVPGYANDVYGWDFYHNRANAYDDNGHGTHCAGVIGAENNSIGVTGIAPRVKILPIKFLGPKGNGDTADAVRAIDYAVARGARVISNSWGGGGYSKLLDDAVQRAINQGVIIVAAAGNDGTNNDTSPSYPANYTNVIAVGSSDSYDYQSSFSNFGVKSVHVFAPGSSILSTYPNGQYRVLSGTSMAAPQVSGAIALAVSLRPRVSGAAVAENLCNSSLNRLSDVSRCGRMDVAGFIKRVENR